MAKVSRLAGSTSHVLTISIDDSSSTTGAGLTGLAFGTSGLTCYYKRNLGTGSVAVTLATITTLGTYVSGGFKEIDAANMPGLYEFHPPDAAYASGAKSVVFLLKGATNMAPVRIEVELTAVDNQSAASFMTGVNGLAPPTRWNSMVIDVSGRVDLGSILGTPSAGAAGSVGIDWAHVANPSTSVSLSGTTVGSLNTISSPQNFNNTGQTTKNAVTLLNTDVTGNLPAAVNSIATDAVSAASVSAGAVTKIQANLALASQIPANFTSALFASAGVFAAAAIPPVLLTPGTGTGQVTLAAGLLSVNMVDANGAPILNGDGTAQSISGTGPWTVRLDAADAKRLLPHVGSVLRMGASDGVITASNTSTFDQTIAAWNGSTPTAGVYSITAPDPAAVAVDSSGRVTLAPAGLDAITVTAPSGQGSPNFRQMLVMVYRRFFRKGVATSTTLTLYADDGTTAISTQTVPAVTSTETQGTAS